MVLKKSILIAVLFLWTSLFFSQSVYIGKVEEIEFSSLDSTRNVMFVFFKDFYKKIDLETFKIDSIKIAVDPEFEFIKYTPLLIDSIHYFVHNHGGLVYVLQNDSIKRIDNSFNHKMQINSNIFVYNSKILRFGGYGFWSARDFLTYFDSDLLEWEAVSPVNSKKVPKGTFAAMYYLNQDEVYFFNGKSIDPFNKTEFYFNNEVWKYNFKSNIWNYLVKIGPIDYLNSINPIVYKNTLLLFNTNEITSIDLVNNKLSTFKKGKYSHYILGSINNYYLNNRFYCLYNSYNTDNYVYLRIVHENEFIGEIISEKSFYSNYNYVKTSFVLLAGLILSALVANFGFNQYKKRKKLILLDNGLRHKNKFTEFDQKGMEILRLLVSDGEVSSNTILKIVEEKQYSMAHNERIKVQKLDEINLKIKTVLGFNGEIVKSKKSDKDKRIRIYFIDKNLIFLNKKRV